MSQIKKHTWKGLAVAAAMLLSVGLMTQTAFASVAVTQIALGTVNLSTNAATGTNTFTALTTNLVLTESAAAQFAVGNTVVLNAPTGWVFDAATPPTAAGTNTLAATTTATATTYTVTISAASVGSAGVLTVSNIRVKPSTASSQPGNITASGTQAATATITAGATLGFISTAATNILITAAPDNIVSSDGTDAATLSFTVRDANNNLLGGIVVNVTTSRGTLSPTSNTTTSTACVTGATTGNCTLTFRGNGTTGTANITATTASPNEAVGLFTAQVVAPTTAATGIKLFDINNSGHVAASLQNVYTTPTLAARVRFQVTGGGGVGVNGDLIQASVDKGYIVQGDSSGTPTAGNQPGSCSGNNTTASDTSAGPVTIDGTDHDGIVVFTVCARAGQVGPIKVTAKNLSTTMTDASATLTSAGVPNKIETVVSGGSVTATIKDKDGNEVADGTTVTFGVPAFTGTVAPTCTTTTNGKATASAAFSGAGGQVLITVFINDTGTGNSSTCAVLGNVAAASTTVNVGAGVTPPPAQGACAGFIGTAPARGSIALLVTNGTCSATNLVAAFATAGCTVESLAILEGGVWKIYINGAPAVVNAAFPATLAGTTAFFVRCAA